jgi:4-amino-4-deoxy-L-arabinose transferase-like glycosyltransferase
MSSNSVNQPPRFIERWGVLVVWLCFLARGLFYNIMFPVWEGFDEYVHFAYVQHVVQKGTLPTAETPVSQEVEESLKLLPLPWMMREWNPSYIIHDQYWKLPAQEREQQEASIYALPHSWAGQPAKGYLPLYEAQQPPLYYWLMSLPLRAASTLSLPGRVFLLRLLSLALASIAIPMGFLLANHVLRSRETALGIVALIAIMPGLMVDICRVGNDCLALALYTFVVYAALRFMQNPEHNGITLLLAFSLGVGLLTKAYFLTAIPAFAVIVLFCFPHHAVKQLLVRGIAVIAIALALSAWWYWRNHILTGSWSGLMQDASLRNTTLGELLFKIREVDWRNALDSTVLSHIWFGNWSFLQVRSWMYKFFSYAGLLALFGFKVYWIRSLLRNLPKTFPHPRHLMVLSAFYFFFCLGICYHVLITFAANGQSSSAGWYLYCLIVVQALLITIGLTVISPAGFRPYVVPAAAISFGLLDFYTAHFISIPYYVGLIGHKPNGFLASFAIGQVREIGIWNIFGRISANKPFLSPPLAIALWLSYLAATTVLMVLVIRIARRAGQKKA